MKQTGFKSGSATRLQAVWETLGGGLVRQHADRHQKPVCKSIQVFGMKRIEYFHSRVEIKTF